MPTSPPSLFSPKIWKVHYLDNWPELNSSTILMRKVLTFPSLKHEDYVGGSYNWELQDSCNYCYFKGCVLPIVLVHFHNVRICIMDHIILNLSAISYHRSLHIVPPSLHFIHFVLLICPLISNLSFHTLHSLPYHPLYILFPVHFPLSSPLYLVLLLSFTFQPVLSCCSQQFKILLIV